MMQLEILVKKCRVHKWWQWVGKLSIGKLSLTESFLPIANTISILSLYKYTFTSSASYFPWLNYTRTFKSSFEWLIAYYRRHYRKQNVSLGQVGDVMIEKGITSRSLLPSTQGSTDSEPYLQHNFNVLSFIDVYEFYRMSTLTFVPINTFWQYTCNADQYGRSRR